MISYDPDKSWTAFKGVLIALHILLSLEKHTHDSCLYWPLGGFDIFLSSKSTSWPPAQSGRAPCKGTGPKGAVMAADKT